MLSDYANVGCTIKTADELEKMRIAGRHVAEILFELKNRVRPGVSTGELDELARREIEKRGIVSAFLGYQPGGGYEPFPGVICASINDEVVHGIPSAERVLKDGDIVSIDFAIFCDGHCGDAAVTVPVGKVSKATRRFLQVAEHSLLEALLQVQVGKRLGDLGHAVQSFAEGHGYGVVREYVGHGIGRKMHEPPSVPNYGQAGRGMRLEPGMTLAIEPMINRGSYETRVGDDGWVVNTADGSLSSHFEHTVAVTEDGPRILTAL